MHAPSWTICWPIAEAGEATRDASEDRIRSERDDTAHVRVGGPIDLPHAAFADEGGDVVVPEPRTDG